MKENRSSDISKFIKKSSSSSKLLEEYRKIQQKYEIPDQYIEIELTEIVVFENLEMLKPL